MGKKKTGRILADVFDHTAEIEEQLDCIDGSINALQELIETLHGAECSCEGPGFLRESLVSDAIDMIGGDEELYEAITFTTIPNMLISIINILGYQHYFVAACRDEIREDVELLDKTIKANMIQNSRIEAKMDAIIEHLGIEYHEPEPKPQEVVFVYRPDQCFAEQSDN